MRQAAIVVHVIDSELLAYASLACAQGDHPPPDRGHRLADGEVDARNEGGVDLPPWGGQPLLDSFNAPEDDPVAHAHQTATSIRLHHWCLEPLRQRQPARRRR